MVYHYEWGYTYLSIDEVYRLENNGHKKKITGLEKRNWPKSVTKYKELLLIGRKSKRRNGPQMKIYPSPFFHHQINTTTTIPSTHFRIFTYVYKYFIFISWFPQDIEVLSMLCYCCFSKILVLANIYSFKHFNLYWIFVLLILCTFNFWLKIFLTKIKQWNIL